LDKNQKKVFKRKWSKENPGKTGKGYHVWHSKDLKEWVHGGQVTHSNWMPTAEYAVEFVLE
jgi:hypothetical protein